MQLYQLQRNAAGCGLRPATLRQQLAAQQPRLVVLRQARNLQCVRVASPEKESLEQAWHKLPAVGLEGPSSQGYWVGFLHRVLSHHEEGSLLSDSEAQGQMFGPTTFKAVLGFQHRYRLECTGSVSAETWQSLLQGHAILQSEVLDPLQWHPRGGYTLQIDRVTSRPMHEDPFSVSHAMTLGTTSLYHVGRLQAALTAAGFEIDDQELSHSHLGPSTFAALLSFQDDTPGLTASGRLDKATWAALSSLTAAPSLPPAEPDNSTTSSSSTSSGSAADLDSSSLTSHTDVKDTAVARSLLSPRKAAQNSAVLINVADTVKSGSVSKHSSEQDTQDVTDATTSSSTKQAEKEDGLKWIGRAGSLDPQVLAEMDDVEVEQSLAAVEAEMHALRMQREQLRLQQLLAAKGSNGAQAKAVKRKAGRKARRPAAPAEALPTAYTAGAELNMGTVTEDAAQESGFESLEEGLQSHAVVMDEQPTHVGGSCLAPWDACPPELSLDHPWGAGHFGDHSFWPDLLHSAMQRKGLFPPGTQTCGSRFGVGSRAALAAFQASVGLQPTGVVDGATWAAVLRGESDLQADAYAALGINF